MQTLGRAGVSRRSVTSLFMTPFARPFVGVAALCCAPEARSQTAEPPDAWAASAAAAYSAVMAFEAWRNEAAGAAPEALNLAVLPSALVQGNLAPQSENLSRALRETRAIGAPSFRSPAQRTASIGQSFAANRQAASADCAGFRRAVDEYQRQKAGLYQIDRLVGRSELVEARMRGLARLYGTLRTGLTDAHQSDALFMHVELTDGLLGTIMRTVISVGKERQTAARAAFTERSGELRAVSQGLAEMLSQEAEVLRAEAERLEELKRQLNQREAANRRLNAELDSAQGYLQDADGELRRLRALAANAEQLAANLRSRISSADGRYNQLRQQISAARLEKCPGDQLWPNCTAHLNERQAWYDKVNRWENEQQQLPGQVANMRNELAQLQARSGTFQQDVANQQSARDARQATVERLTSRVAQDTAQLEIRRREEERERTRSGADRYRELNVADGQMMSALVGLLDAPAP